MSGRRMGNADFDPISFGFLTTTAFVLTLFSRDIFLQCFSNKKWLWVGLLALSFILIVASGSRFPIALAMVAIVGYIVRQFGLSITKIITVMVIGAVLSFLLKDTVPVFKRYESVVKNVQKASEGDFNSSIGHRFIMWSVAWDVFKQNIVIGKGNGAFRDYSQQNANIDKNINKVKRYRAPHNEYLNTLSSRGVVGIVVLFVFLGGLLKYFYSVRGGGVSDAGVAFIAFVFLWSFLNDLFETNFYAAFIAYIFSLLLAIIYRETIVRNEMPL
ncbi:MAG: O-antigen ligase family protein [Arenibacter algicola]|nr:O-antigen ligase family protein [Arenibacter algicola]